MNATTTTPEFTVEPELALGWILALSPILQLFAAFLVENIVWGFPNAFGSFLEVYLKDPTFTSQKHAESLLPLIGAVNSGIMYVSGEIYLLFYSTLPVLTMVSIHVSDFNPLPPVK